MDLITLDVSNVPENECHEGSLVTLLDSKYTIDDFAKDSGTIGYEVLTSLGTRYHRVWSESSPQEKS